MIPNTKKINIEKSASITEHSFGISDLGMIFEILRNKLYSNKILAVCREYSCNARDAHREVGNQDLPIEITLPNAMSPNFRVRDFGPGVSPDRMENIFVKYASSTKRGDNIQTGMMGIGSKSAFCYTDSFSIITRIDGTKRSYIAFIDETKVGKVSLVSESDTDEANGTDIVVPVKPHDFNSFAIAMEQCTRYWKIKPIIKGGNIKYFSPPGEILLEKDNWKIYDRMNSYSRNNVIVTCDGIEYDFDSQAFFSQNNFKWLNNSTFNGLILIDFPLGSISIGANRESIDLDKNTISILINALNKINDVIVDEAKKKVNSATSLLDASSTLRDLQGIFKGVIGNGFTWRGKNVPVSQISFNKDDLKITKFAPKRSYRRSVSKKDIFDRSIYYSIDLVYTPKDYRFFYNDLNLELNLKTVKKLALNAKWNINEGISILEAVSDAKSIEDCAKEYNFEDYGFEPISNFIGETEEEKQINLSGKRLSIFKYTRYKGFCRASLQEFKEYKAQDNAVITELSEDYKKLKSAIIFGNKSSYNDNVDLEMVLDKKQLFGFFNKDNLVSKDHLDKIFKDVPKFDDMITKSLSDIKMDEVAELTAFQLEGRNYSVSNTFPRALNKTFLNLIKNKKSIILAFQEETDRLLELEKKYTGMKMIFQVINLTLDEYLKSKNITVPAVTNKELMRLNKLVIKTYPIIQYCDSYGYSDPKKNAVLNKSFADYVNLIDEVNEI